MTISISLPAFDCEGDTDWTITWEGGMLVVPNPPVEPVEIEVPCTPGTPVTIGISAYCNDDAPFCSYSVDI